MARGETKDSSSSIASTVHDDVPASVDICTPVEGDPIGPQTDLEKIRPNLWQRIKAFLLGPPFVCTMLLIAAGTAVAFQSGTNAAMRNAAGRSFASVMNFSTGSSFCIMLFVCDLLFLKTPPPQPSGIKGTPWYGWIGGALGTYYVVINILTIPDHGAGTVLSIFVCAQVVTGCLMDHFGLTGVVKRKYSIYRIIASVVLIGCVAVITLF